MRIKTGYYDKNQRKHSINQIITLISRPSPEDLSAWKFFVIIIYLCQMVKIVKMSFEDLYKFRERFDAGQSANLFGTFNFFFIIIFFKWKKSFLISFVALYKCRVWVYYTATLPLWLAQNTSHSTENNWLSENYRKISNLNTNLISVII